MKLLLIGHTERYPVEQLQMQLFPDEPSEFVTQSFTGDGTVSSLSRGKKYLTATAKVTKGGKTGFASPHGSVCVCFYGAPEPAQMWHGQ